MRRPLYKPRAVLVGTLYWNCPDCGQLTRSRLSWRKFFGKCSNPLCRRTIVFGVRFQPVIQGARTDKLPPDYRVLDDSLRDPMPVAGYDPVPWRAGQPVHRLEEPVGDPYPENQKPN